VSELLVEKPINVQVIGESSTSLLVTWDINVNSSSSSAAAASYYRVFFYELTNLVSGEMDVTAEQRQAVINDLCQLCEYNVQVVAYAVNGTSHSSDEVTGRTLSDGKFSFT